VRQEDRVPARPAPRARRRVVRDPDRGSLHVAAIPMVLGLVLLAILVIATVGSAVADRRTAVTAADAAALAVAHEIDETLEELYTGRKDTPLAEPSAPEVEEPGNGDPGDGGGGSDGESAEPPEGHVPAPEPAVAAIWEIAGRPITSFVDQGAAYAAAERFAEANGTELVLVRLDPDRWVVTVEVEHEDALHDGTDDGARAVASARVQPVRGMCVDRGIIGVRLDLRCVTRPPHGDESVTSPELEDYASRVSLVG